MNYLSGAITYEPAISEASEGSISSRAAGQPHHNLDRTPRNPNLLNWNKELWLIDHGASLYFHHAWGDYRMQAAKLFPLIKDHVLLQKATQLPKAARTIKTALTQEAIEGVLALIPDEWLEEEGSEFNASEKRTAYQEYLSIRLNNLDELTQEAENARHAAI